MRKKLISKTYLKDVSKYKLEIYFNQDDYYLSVKKIIEIKEPFILPTGLCFIDNGYYIGNPDNRIKSVAKKGYNQVYEFFDEKKW